MLLPVPRRRKRHPGRKRLDDRRMLTGNLFVLQSGIAWEMLPNEMGCGSGMTCWRRLRAWQKAGVWTRLYQALLAKLRGADQLDFSRVIPDTASVRAVHGGNWTEHYDCRQAGSKHHLLVDAQGIPLNVMLTQANRLDVTQLMPLLEGVVSITGKRGRPLHKPKCVQADRGYDSHKHRQTLQSQGIRHQIARRRTDHGSHLGKTRWVVERTLAWLHQFRRLRVCYERMPSIHEAFLHLGCAIICWRVLKNHFVRRSKGGMSSSMSNYLSREVENP
jgi:transposase